MLVYKKKQLTQMFESEEFPVTFSVYQETQCGKFDIISQNTYCTWPGCYTGFWWWSKVCFRNFSPSTLLKHNIYKHTKCLHKHGSCNLFAGFKRDERSSCDCSFMKLAWTPPADSVFCIALSCAWFALPPVVTKIAKNYWSRPLVLALGDCACFCPCAHFQESRTPGVS